MSKSTTIKTTKLFLHHIWKYPIYVIGILLTTPLSILSEQYLSAIILANVLARLSKGNFQSGHVWASFGSSIILYAILTLIGTIGWRVVDAFNWRLESSVERDLIQRIYAHLLKQSANFHANTFGGSLVSQTNKLMSAYVRVADTSIFMVLQLLSSLLFTVVILAPRAPLFVVLLLIVSVAYLVSGVFVTKTVRKLTAELASGESEETGYLADTITNIMAVKSFANEWYEKLNFGKITKKNRDKTLEVGRASQKQMAYFSVLNRVVLILALVMAIVSVMIFKVNIATVFLIFSYTGTLVSLLWQFCNNALRNYNRAFGDAADMTNILEIEPEVKDPINPEKLRIDKGKIEFKNVEFMHDGGNDALFKDLNVTVNAGERIGLVGHSGSGKTTFMRLLLRFSDVDSGEILIDGQNIAHLTQDDLRKNLAYVPQEPIMFHRSLTENIQYGDFNASQEDILKASKSAHADEFITALPDKYDTLVGERGVKLSGGQRQRIAIARAILKDAPILVLDEATSALDSESEVLIQDALWKLMKDRTAIVIAHRLSTIQKMDRIIVLEEGKVAEIGTHKELVNAKGIYAQLWEHQSGGFIEE